MSASPSAAPPPLRVLIADDEELARQRVRRLLEAEAGVAIVGECATGREAVEAIRREAPDLVFLDIRMPEMDGFQVLDALGAEGVPPVVFVTAYDEHAVRAFDVHAVDYLLKPFDAQRFRAAVERARAQIGQASAAERFARLSAIFGALDERAADAGDPRAGPAPALAERLLVRKDGRTVFVRVPDVDWVEAVGNYAKLHVGKQAHMLRETMNNLERTLDPSRFVRIHRSTIVNLDRVREMQPWFSGEQVMILHDGTQLRVSRWYRERLEKRLERG